MRRILIACSAITAASFICACSSDDSGSSEPNTTPGNDAGVDAITDDVAAEAQQPQPEAGPEPDAEQPDSSVSDPLCPDGLACVDHGSGSMACLENGAVPASASLDCEESGCSGNQHCAYVDDTQTQTACIENCGTCGSGTTCMDVTGDGYFGCLEAGYIPEGAPTGCHENGGCEGNATCFYINEELTESVCIDNCSPCKEGTCPEGEYCDNGMCMPNPCTEDSCPTGEICYEGTCIPDFGDGPGPDTVGDCPNLPPLHCDPTTEDCAELIQFDPTVGDGYNDYPENGETSSNQYRSWLRRDAVYLVKYAAAYVACKAKDWTFGNGGNVGLIDMSEENGDIPGTSIGEPGHPEGTHTDGHDIDIAYFQVNTSDNRARPICDHYVGGAEAYHCTAAPHLLDPWRTALFIGAMFEHSNLRVIGCDGKAGPMLEMALDKLCADGWLSTKACSTNKLTYEETNQGYGWYLFHHHHIHVSFSGTPTASAQPATPACLIPGCDEQALRTFYGVQALPLTVQAFGSGL